MAAQSLWSHLACDVSAQVFDAVNEELHDVVEVVGPSARLFEADLVIVGSFHESRSPVAAGIVAIDLDARELIATHELAVAKSLGQRSMLSPQSATVSPISASSRTEFFDFFTRLKT